MRKKAKRLKKAVKRLKGCYHLVTAFWPKISLQKHNFHCGQMDLLGDLFVDLDLFFLDAIASPSTYPCQWVSESLKVSDLEIAITSPSLLSRVSLSLCSKCCYYSVSEEF